MPRVGQLRLGRAAPALCGAPAASQPPRAARGGHSRPRWPTCSCTAIHHPTPPQPGDGPRPLPERFFSRSAGLHSPGSWTFGTGSSQRRASTRPPPPPPRIHADAARAGAAEMYGAGSPATTGEQAAAHSAAGSGAIPPAQAARGSSLSPASGQAAQTGQAAAAAAPMPSPPASVASSTPQAGAARDRGRAPRAREPRSSP